MGQDSGLCQEQEFKQMFGLITEMKSFVNKMSPGDLRKGFTGYRTNNYRLNYYETASGLKFVLNTEINTNGQPRDVLHQFFENIIVPTIVKSPIGNLDDTLKNQLFDTKVDEFFKKSTL